MVSCDAGSVDKGTRPEMVSARCKARPFMATFLAKLMHSCSLDVDAFVSQQTEKFVDKNKLPLVLCNADIRAQNAGASTNSTPDTKIGGVATPQLANLLCPQIWPTLWVAHSEAR